MEFVRQLSLFGKQRVLTYAIGLDVLGNGKGPVLGIGRVKKGADVTCHIGHLLETPSNTLALRCQKTVKTRYARNIIILV